MVRKNLFLLLLAAALFASLSFAGAEIYNITLTSPANNYDTNNNTPTFNFTVKSTTNATDIRCELFIENTGYGFNETTRNNTATVLVANSTVSDGILQWNINCTDANGTNSSATRIIAVDTTSPILAFNSPTPDDNQLININSIVLNASIIEPIGRLENFTYAWNNTNYTRYPSSFLLHYQFDNNTLLLDNSTYAVDSWRYSYNLTLYGATWADGKYGKALNFDGVNDYASSSISPNISGNFTLALWIYRRGNPSSTSNNVIFDIGNNNADNGFGLWIRGSDNSLGWRFNSSAATYVGITPTLNTWEYYVLRYNGTAVDIFKNGVKSSSTPWTGNPAPAVDYIRFGSRETNAGFYNGSIDDFMIWNSGLSDLSITQTYLAQLSRVNLTSWNFYSNQTDLQTRSYSYFVKACDYAGNCNITSTRTLSIDVSFPTFYNLSGVYLNNTTTSSNFSILNYSFTDGTNLLKNFTFTLNSIAYRIYDESLLLFYNFDNNANIGDSATKAVDNSKYSSNLTISGATWRKGEYNGSLVFDGANDYANSSSSPNITGSFTLSVWINRTGAPSGNDNVIFDLGNYSSGNGFGLWIDSSSQLGWRINTEYDRYQTNLIPALNTWEHYVLRYNGTAVDIFKNGVKNSSSLWSTNPLSAVNYMKLGSRETNTQLFKGALDEFMLWNRSLSDSEISKIYSSNLQKYNSTLWYFYAQQTNLSSGNYTHYLTACDNANNCNSSTARTVTVDLDAPVITVYSPTAKNYTSTNITINFTAADPTDGIALKWFSNGTTNITYTNPTSIILADNTTHTLIFYANDSSGSIGSSTVIITVNSSYVSPTKPVINVTSPTAINYTTTSITVNFNATDSDGISSLWYFNGTANRTYTSPHTITLPDQASYTFIFYANDTYNTLNSTSVTFRINTTVIDVTAPTLTVYSPANNTNYSGFSVLINFTATDAVNVSSKWYFNGTANVTYGNATSGNAGNITLPVGTYTFIFYANDTSNNVASASRLFRILGDIEPPVITVTSPAAANYTNTSVVVNFTAADDYAVSSKWFSNGTTNITYSDAVTISMADQATHTFIFYANDTSNNLNYTSVTFSINTTDTIFPSISVISPLADNYSITNISIEFSASDAFGISSKWFSNGTANITYTAPTSIYLENGTYTFTFYANDTSNNLNYTSVTFSINTSLPDSTLPVLTVYSPAASSNHTAYVLINFTASDLNRAESFWYSNGTANITYSSPVSLNLANGTSNATYTFIFYANDTFGNVNSTSRTFNVLRDLTAPAVTLNSPANEYSTTSSSINFEFNVSEAHGMSNCTLYLNSVSYANTSSISTASTNTISASGLGTGTYSWNVSCSDEFGNTGLSSSRNLTITSASSGGGGGGGGGYWDTTFVTDTSFISGYTATLNARDRIRVNVNGEAHYIGVIKINKTAGFIIINVSSTPQQAVLYLGDEKKFDVTNDNIYDISVSFTGWGKSSGAVLFVKKISEAMPGAEIPETPAVTPSAPVTAPQEPSPAPEEEPEPFLPEEGEWSKMLIIGILVFLIAVILIILIAIGVNVSNQKKFASAVKIIERKASSIVA